MIRTIWIQHLKADMICKLYFQVQATSCNVYIAREYNIHKFLDQNWYTN